MLILTGKNLGERQKELNAKVNEAASHNVDFGEIKNKTEQSDIDKLFKIDLASKHMNIEYIVEVLKSGDSLHISRALKCAWMFDNDFANVINVDNLHHNLFPFMSLKMKKKLLTTAAAHIRHSDRSEAFHKYCTDMKLNNIALKFIIFTSDTYKLNFIRTKPSQLNELKYKNDFKHFIGSSFTLADAHLEMMTSDSIKITGLCEINFLYSVSDVKYLDMLEKHVGRSSPHNSSRLGLRISKDILSKHKTRVLQSPALYVNFMNKSSVAKYSTSENAKTYLLALLPAEVDSFWQENFGQSYEHILNILPAKERFEFLQEIFNNKYSNEPFEMCSSFYDQQYYNFMTDDEKEKWALDHIASQKEILGIGKDFIWYKFVHFGKAFEEIKKLIMITKDKDKRIEMINVLVECAKSQQDLEKLFKYYYDRHNNEQQYIKENFIDWITYNHNIYEFDSDCWVALNKILQNLDVYNMLNNDKCKSELKIIALIYHIINKIEPHDALKLYVSTNMYFYTLKQNTNKLIKKQEEMVFQFLFNFYMDKINELNSVPYEDEVKYKLRTYIYFILDLLDQYERTKKDIPEVVMKLMKLDWDEFSCHRLNYEAKPKPTTQADLLRFLKKDAKLAVEHLPLLKKTLEAKALFNMDQLLKKLKVYFSNDVSQEYLKFFYEMLNDPQLYTRNALAAVYAIFQLADENSKIEFMTKHAPTQSKVNRSEMDEKLLNIQEAICATAFYSRPPVPLNDMLKYVKGDYVHSCLPMFTSYLANLPLPLCMEFVEAILNTPLSIQKHGVRLAFACFNTENLKKLVLYIWKKNKNISLRLIIYKALYEKIVNEDRNTQAALFETLNTLTSGLHQDDDNEIFTLLSRCRIPEYLASDYMNTVWATVKALPKNITNIERMTDVLKCITNNIQSLRQDIVRPIVVHFIGSVFDSEESNDFSAEIGHLKDTKWELTENHIMYVQNKEDLETKLELTKQIMNLFLSKWNVVTGNEYVARRICFHFLRRLVYLSYNNDCGQEGYTIELMENVLAIVRASFKIEDTYMTIWNIQLNVVCRKAINESRMKLNAKEEKSENFNARRDIIISFGQKICKLIMEFIEKGIFFKSYLPDIYKLLEDSVESYSHFLDKYCIKLGSVIEYNIKSDDVLVLVSLALMEFKTNEMNMFALNILPSDYCSTRPYIEDYKSVLNEIKKLDDAEIKCKMYAKFVYSDFKLREYLQL